MATLVFPFPELRSVGPKNPVVSQIFCMDLGLTGDWSSRPRISVIWPLRPILRPDLDFSGPNWSRKVSFEAKSAISQPGSPAGRLRSRRGLGHSEAEFCNSEAGFGLFRPKLV